MITSLYAAASGMAAQQTGIDLIANNLANANTTGYKQARPEFADLLYQQLAPGVEVGAGSRLAATFRSFRPGAVSRTDNPLDLAITGNGFFHLKRLDGTNLYSRDGALGVDSERRLVGREGAILQGETGPIQIPAEVQGVVVRADGRVTYEDAVTHQEVEAGRIQLASFPNPAGLSALGSNLFIATAASGSDTLGQPGTGDRGKLEQGALEASNVEVVQEMVGLIVAQRVYELNSKAVQSSDEMLGIANNLRR